MNLRNKFGVIQKFHVCSSCLIRHRVTQQTFSPRYLQAEKMLLLKLFELKKKRILMIEYTFRDFFILSAEYVSNCLICFLSISKALLQQL